MSTNFNLYYLPEVEKEGIFLSMVERNETK
jgi:hypothetical protein